MDKPINPGEKFPVDVTVRREPHNDGTVMYTLHVPDADDQVICKAAIEAGRLPEEWVYGLLDGALGFIHRHIAEHSPPETAH